MHVSHFASSCSNPNAPQAAWNVGCFVSSIIWRCLKEVTPGTIVSRRQRKKHSLAARCMKYIHPIIFSPCCRVDQTFSRILAHPENCLFACLCVETFWTCPNEEEEESTIERREKRMVVSDILSIALANKFASVAIINTWCIQMIGATKLAAKTFLEWWANQIGTSPKKKKYKTWEAPHLRNKRGDYVPKFISLPLA